MIQKIGYIAPINKDLSLLNKQTKNISNPYSNSYSDSVKSQLSGVPRSYISFTGQKEDSKYVLTDDAQTLVDIATTLAKEVGHESITPAHIIQASIIQTLAGIKSVDPILLSSGAITSISPLHKLTNEISGINMLESESSAILLSTLLEYLDEENKKVLMSIESVENKDDEIYKSKELNFSDEFETFINNTISKAPTNEFNSYNLLGAAFNYMISKNYSYATDFLKSTQSIRFYRSKSDMEKDYVSTYNERALEVWNKLALGSNLFVTYEDIKEASMLASSFVATLDDKKHGNFNSDNTRIYVMSDNIKAPELLDEMTSLTQEEPDKKHIFLVDMNSLLINSMTENEDGPTFKPEILGAANLAKNNIKIIFFQSDAAYWANMQSPFVKNAFSEFLQYSIPPMHMNEAKVVINTKKELTESLSIPYTKEAKEKAVMYADKLNGIYPYKAVDFMQRIANYYEGERKRIGAKDVENFVLVGKELFTNSTDNDNVTYDTGKTLNSFYGKDTTKKDVEAIVKQIKTGKIGTKGYVIYSKDVEAGSGRRFTAQTIAGEAKVPFLEINSSDFAITTVDEDNHKVDPKYVMHKLFVDAKKSALQNEHKTAVIFINKFEELAFSSPYLPGYKRAMSQLEEEMSKAESEKVNLVIIGSTDEDYVEYIPLVLRGFSNNIVVDSPARNHEYRRDILVNRIREVNLPLDYKTQEEKDIFINKLVKISQHMSFVEIKSLVEKAGQIMTERNHKKANIGDFIEGYLQLCTGRTSHPQIPEYNKRATTSHECGHATNLEVMNNLIKTKGKPWMRSKDVNFITLDPRGDFLGAVFGGKTDNSDYPFEAMFSDLVCSYGGYSCEKKFFDMEGSAGISQDLASVTRLAKIGVEYYGFGKHTGQISNAAQIQSGKYSETVFADMNIILQNAKMVSDLITDTYAGFNEWFTNKYSRLIGTDECMVDGDDFRAELENWKKSQSPEKQEEFEITDDIILDIIKAAKDGKVYGKKEKKLSEKDNIVVLKQIINKM